jgi:hypothetical protein
MRYLRLQGFHWKPLAPGPAAPAAHVTTLLGPGPGLAECTSSTECTATAGPTALAATALQPEYGRVPAALASCCNGCQHVVVCAEV